MKKLTSLSLALIIALFTLTSCSSPSESPNATTETNENTTKVTTIAPETTEPVTTAVPETTDPVTTAGDSTEPVTTMSGVATSPTTEMTPVVVTEVSKTTITSDTTTSPVVTDAPKAALRLISVTSPVNNNEMATLTIVGKPNTKYSITVLYSTKASRAKGLEDKTSDANGNVSWTWKVGANTASGEHTIKITGGDESISTKFTTEE